MKKIQFPRARTLLCVAAISLGALSIDGCKERTPADKLADRTPGVSDGTWQGTDARSTWHATLDGPRVAQLDEISIFTDSTRAARQFRFDSTGALTTAREERFQKVFGNAALPDTINTIIDLEWLADSLVRSQKRVNGQTRLLQPFEVDNMRAHADELFRTARAAPSTRKQGR